jgi:hypothetical protein
MGAEPTNIIAETPINIEEWSVIVSHLGHVSGHKCQAYKPALS